MNERSRLSPSLPLILALAAATLTFAQPNVSRGAEHPALKDPSKANLTAPATFTAKFETTKGDVLFDCTRDWAPHGADRFYNLVKIGFFTDIALFRVMKGFVVQWGIHGDPEVSKHWSGANLPPDPVKQSNTPGMLSFAMAGGSNKTRTTQMFINYGNNANLDGMGFSPVCKVSKGMDVAQSFNGEYKGAPSNAQGKIKSDGNAFLKEKYPNLDYIKQASIVKEGDKVIPPGDSGGKKGDAGAKGDEEKGSNTTYILVGLLAVGALVAFMFMRGNNEEEEEEPAPRRRRKKAANKKSATKKTAVKKKAAKKKTAAKKTAKTTSPSSGKKKKKKKKSRS